MSMAAGASSALGSQALFSSTRSSPTWHGAAQLAMASMEWARTMSRARPAAWPQEAEGTESRGGFASP